MVPRPLSFSGGGTRPAERSVSSRLSTNPGKSVASATISIRPFGIRLTRPGVRGMSGITRASREIPSRSVTAKTASISRIVTS